jgi:drug/metabolite transporter (DMT)-like permease
MAKYLTAKSGQLLVALSMYAIALSLLSTAIVFAFLALMQIFGFPQLPVYLFVAIALLCFATYFWIIGYKLHNKARRH